MTDPAVRLSEAVVEYTLRDVPVIYGWIYRGQPRSRWPRWLRTHYTGMFSDDISKHEGRIAVASYHSGCREFWRWFDLEDFERIYIPTPAGRAALTQGRESKR